MEEGSSGFEREITGHRPHCGAPWRNFQPAVRSQIRFSAQETCGAAMREPPYPVSRPRAGDLDIGRRMGTRGAGKQLPHRGVAMCGVESFRLEWRLQFFPQNAE
jgi:hypothetical protein